MQESVKEERWRYIGGSDVPCIMGISPFKKRFDLLLEKAQLKENDFPGNEYTEYGNIMEGKIRDYINQFTEDKFLEDKVIKDDLRYHSDGFNGNTVLEIKTTSRIHKEVDDYKVYLVQLLFGMQMHNVENGMLAVYERPKDFDEEFNQERLITYQIRKSDYKQLLEDINVAINQFRIDLEKIKANPFIAEEELQPTEVIELSDKVIALENQLASYKELEKQYKTFKADLYKAMQKYQIKKWEMLNGYKVTRVDATEDKEIEVEKFNDEQFMLDHPKLYAKYLTITKEIKKGKSGHALITPPKEK